MSAPHKVFPHWGGVRRFVMCWALGSANLIDGLTIITTGRSWALGYQTALWSAKSKFRRTQ